MMERAPPGRESNSHHTVSLSFFLMAVGILSSSLILTLSFSYLRIIILFSFTWDPEIIKEKDRQVRMEQRLIIQCAPIEISSFLGLQARIS